MDEASYKREILVAAKAAAVFEALTVGVDRWWSTAATTAEQAGSILRVDFGSTFKLFVVRELKENTSVVWECIVAHMDVPTLTKRDEWLGTVICWEISAHGAGSRVTLNHHGLVPEMQCFEMCAEGWERFFAGSLKAYLETGQGRPFISN